jgi:hypothetical protein
MTVSTLGEVEACPRRWALGAAKYPNIWDGHGYPPRVHASALAGTVVHLMLERITKQFVRAGCASTTDPQTSAVLRELGGYTKVAQECVDRVLSQFGGNPRAARILENVGSILRAQVPEMRVRAQAILSRIRLAERTGSQGGQASAAIRNPLSAGAYSETVLQAPQIGWKGKVDLLVLTDTECEISDFKTGARDDAHAFQLLVYALLWRLDGELNPRKRDVTRLEIAYVNEDVQVPTPDVGQLEELKQLLIVRREAAQQAISARPPVALPSSDNCRYCGVRQLCHEYWTPETQSSLTTAADARRFEDAEIAIVGRHGHLSWDAKVLLSRSVPTGRRALLRTQEPLNLTEGARLRVIDAAIASSPEDDSQVVIISVGQFSEIYVMKSD